MQIPHSSHAAAEGSVKVLIVEGQTLVRDGLASLIDKTEGLVVSGTAGNVEEAIRLACRQRPDVFLLSLVTPDRAALDAVRTIQAQFAGAKVLLLDEFVLDAHLRRALQIGVAGYMTKQDAFDDIAQALRRAQLGLQSFSRQVADRLVSTPRGLRFDPDRQAGKLSGLTPREIEVLIYLAQGLTVKECAQVLRISPSTVDNHKSRMMKKLNMHKTVDLTRLAIREGLAARP